MKSLLSELQQVPIPEAALLEMEYKLQSGLHSMILQAFSESGLTQQQLAERLGWDESKISRLLGSAHTLTFKSLSALLAAIQIDPSYITFRW